MTSLSRPSSAVIRKLREHQVWLESGGIEGRQFKAIGLQLESVCFDGLDLSVSDLGGSRFLNCSFQETRFIGAFVDDVSFERSNLTNSRFDGAWCYLTRFLGAKYPGVSFAEAHTEDTIWTWVDVEERQQRYARVRQSFSEAESGARITKREQSQQIELSLAHRQRVHQQRIVAGLRLWQKLRLDIPSAPELWI